jgi:hypothetical protein
MNKDNETYLKLFVGGGGSNNQKRCLFSKKAKVTAITTTTVVALFFFVATFCDFATWNTVSYYFMLSHSFLYIFVKKFN